MIYSLNSSVQKIEFRPPSHCPPWERRKENDGNLQSMQEERETREEHGLTVTEEDAVEGREERAAEGVALAPPAPLPLRLGTVRPLRLVQLLPLLSHLHPPVLPLRRHCRPHLHRLHDLLPPAPALRRRACA